MSENLRRAKKIVGNSYLTRQMVQRIATLSLVSIAESLERLADKFAPACEDGYDAEEEEEC